MVFNPLAPTDGWVASLYGPTDPCDGGSMSEMANEWVRRMNKVMCCNNHSDDKYVLLNVVDPSPILDVQYVRTDISDAKRHVYRQRTICRGVYPLYRLDILQTVRIDRRTLYTQVHDISILARQHLQTNLQEIHL